MQTQLRDKQDIKIYIMYLMQKVGYPLGFNDINDIVCQDGYVKYFDFAECFAELLENGQLTEIKKESPTPLYMVSPLGTKITETLEDSLLSSTKELGLKHALRLLSFRKRESDIRCTVTEQEDGQYQVHCSIEEKGEVIFSLNLLVSSMKQAEKMRLIFDNRPEHIYKGILALLTGEVDYLFDKN